jgi:hypothetical protein
VPTGALAIQVIPIFVKEIPNSLQTSMAEQITLKRNFGLGYDSLGTITGTSGTWYLITTTNLDVDAPWSQANAGDTTGAGLDASWFIEFVFNSGFYTVSFRALDYYFGSVTQTRFFFSGDQLVYDSRTGTTISDFINVLKTNSQPTSAAPLGSDIITKIVGQPIQIDGLVDDYQVLVSFSNRNNDGVPDNPDFFQEVIGPVPNPASAVSPWVFLKRIVDFDNLQRYVLIDSGIVNSQYATENNVLVVLAEYVPGQVFYTYTDDAFYILVADVTTGVRSLVTTDEYIAQTGRQNLFFQYRHNSPLTNRIDPGTTNIIDVYVVTNEYYIAYTNYVQDTTNTVIEPQPPTLDFLNTAYAGLNNYKMLSDTMILNSVQFQPLFGAKALPELRATIKVIRAAQSVASTSEIQNLIVQYLNQYFSLDLWDFGDTFYFSELSGFLHNKLSGIVSSVVLVPLNPDKYFGSLYEIRCAPNQIFVNGATVQNIEVITALTPTNIRTSPDSGVTFAGGRSTSSGSTSSGSTSGGSTSGGSGGGGSY